MSSEYLLPCPCGLIHRVSQQQAGEAIACSCGARLDVPTLRELRRLAPAPDIAGPPAAVWGRRQGLAFLGLLVAAVGLVALGYFYFVRMPATPDFVTPQWALENLDPIEVLAFWRQAQQGIGRQVPNDAAYIIELTRQARWGMRISLGVVVAGLLIAGSGLLTKTNRK